MPPPQPKPKRARPSLQRAPYPPASTRVALSHPRPKKPQQPNRRRACDHCKSARRRCTSTSQAEGNIAELEATTRPPCEACVKAKRECSFSSAAESEGVQLVKGVVGSAGGWEEQEEGEGEDWTSAGKIAELDQRLAALEVAVQVKLAEAEISALLAKGGKEEVLPLDLSEKPHPFQFDADQLQDGVRRLSVQQPPRPSSALDLNLHHAKEDHDAQVNESRLSHAQDKFDLAWLYEALAPSPSPGGWSVPPPEQAEGREELARELRGLVEGLSGGMALVDSSPFYSSSFDSPCDALDLTLSSPPATPPSWSWTPTPAPTSSSSSPPASPSSPYTAFNFDFASPCPPSFTFPYSRRNSSSMLDLGQLALDEGVERVGEWRWEEAQGRNMGAAGGGGKSRPRARTLDDAFRMGAPAPRRDIELR